MSSSCLCACHPPFCTPPPAPTPCTLTQTHPLVIDVFTLVLITDENIGVVNLFSLRLVCGSAVFSLQCVKYTMHLIFLNRSYREHSFPRITTELLYPTTQWPWVLSTLQFEKTLTEHTSKYVLETCVRFEIKEIVTKNTNKGKEHSSW